MTKEQLDYFAQQTEHVATRAAKNAVRTYRNRALAGFIVLILGIGYVQHSQASNATTARNAIVKSGRVVSVTGCNRDFRTQTALRGVLQASESFSKQAAKNGTITQADLAERVKFYETQINNLELPDCRAAQAILTDDPRTIGDVPPALHPPDATPTP